MQTLAEMPEFIRHAGKLLSASEKQELLLQLAAKPKAGVLIQGAGGIRKLRWAREGSGKSGGVRVVYYFHNEHMPLYLLTLFGKGAKANLTKAERNELASLVRLLVQAWEHRK